MSMDSTSSSLTPTSSCMNPPKITVCKLTVCLKRPIVQCYSSYDLIINRVFLFCVFHSFIQERIKNIINDQQFLLIYKSSTEQPAFIADEYCCGEELFQGLVNR